MPKRPRLADIFGPDRTRRRPLVTHDGALVVQGESFAIWGEPLAVDERPEPSIDNVTFDGAMPSIFKSKDPR